MDDRWPDISSPLALKVVRAAWGGAPLIPLERDQHDYLALLGLTRGSMRTYQQKVRAALQESALAQLLPAGTDMLPDVNSSMRWPGSSIALLARPRNYRDLVRHVVDHLAWYLRLESSANLPYRFIVKAVLAVLAGFWLLSQVLGSAGLPQAASVTIGLAFAIFVGWIVVAAGKAIYNGTRRIFRLGVAEPRGDRQAIHAAEFYYYLRSAYADPLESEQEGIG